VVLLVAALVAVLVVGTGERAPAAFSPPLAIMPLGDSITMGSNVSGAYRTALEDLLVADGTSFGFVGTLNAGPPELADRDHEGHPGFAVWQVEAGIGGWLAATDPDVILLMIGTNDFNGDDEDVPGVPGHLAGLLNRIELLSPDAHVFVASIPPFANRVNDQQARTYNATILPMVHARANRGFPITFVDIYSALTLADLEEGVHPNATGYAKIAAAWRAALLPFIGPGAPSVAVTSPGAATVIPGGTPSVELTASAGDPDGTIAKVEFFVDGDKIAEDGSPPYAATWANPSSGAHQLRARATDDGGVSVSSATVAVSVSPAADFTAAPTAGTAPLSIQFTDRSTGSPTAWAWDFQNDGATDSNAQNPSFTYATPGTYSVRLTATYPGGSDVELKTGYVVVTAASSPTSPPPPTSPATPLRPTARFAASPTSGQAALLVRFSDDSSGSPTSWVWDFDGDGRVDSTAQNPSFTYARPGTYTVRLTVGNAAGSDSATTTVEVAAAAPVTRRLLAAAAVSVVNRPARLPVGTLRVQSGPTRYRTYLRFRVPAVAGRVTNVRLRLWVANGNGRAFVYRCSPGWPKRITWATAPRLRGRALARTPSVRRGRWIEIALPAAVITDANLVTLALLPTASASVVYSGRGGSHPPQLLVTSA
jgi:PKD repeat protein